MNSMSYEDSLPKKNEVGTIDNMIYNIESAGSKIAGLVGYGKSKEL